MMIKRWVLYSFTFQTFLAVLMVIFASCSAEKNKKESKLYRFVPAIFTSEDFLNRWNKATIADIETKFSQSDRYKKFLIEEYQNDSTASAATSRREFLKILKSNWSLPDSFCFKNIYILEMKSEGEYVSYRNYYIIDTEEEDYFYELRSNSGSWEIKKSKTGDFSSVAELFKDWEKVNQKDREDHNSGPVIFTKANQDTIISKVVIDPTERQMNRVKAFLKYVRSTPSELKQKTPA